MSGAIGQLHDSVLCIPDLQTNGAAASDAAATPTGAAGAAGGQKVMEDWEQQGFKSKAQMEMVEQGTRARSARMTDVTAALTLAVGLLVRASVGVQPYETSTCTTR